MNLVLIEPQKQALAHHASLRSSLQLRRRCDNPTPDLHDPRCTQPLAVACWLTLATLVASAGPSRSSLTWRHRRTRVVPAPLQGWAFTARLCGRSTATSAGERYVERFIQLLWDGVGVASP
jgi:hypothetical protein